MVWGIDDQRNIYAREAIFPELPIGTDWVLAPAVEAVQLAISDAAVYAVSPKGEIFRRCGISGTNFVGDCWILVDCNRALGSVKVVTASVCDKLWAIDGNGQLITHSSESVLFSRSSNLATKSLDEEDVDWELLG